MTTPAIPSDSLSRDKLRLNRGLGIGGTNKLRLSTIDPGTTNLGVGFFEFTNVPVSYPILERAMKQFVRMVNGRDAASDIFKLHRDRPVDQHGIPLGWTQGPDDEFSRDEILGFKCSPVKVLWAARADVSRKDGSAIVQDPYVHSDYAPEYDKIPYRCAPRFDDIAEEEEEEYNNNEIIDLTPPSKNKKEKAEFLIHPRTPSLRKSIEDESRSDITRRFVSLGQYFASKEMRWLFHGQIPVRMENQLDQILRQKAKPADKFSFSKDWINDRLPVNWATAVSIQALISGLDTIGGYETERAFCLCAGKYGLKHTLETKYPEYAKLGNSRADEDRKRRMRKSVSVEIAKALCIFWGLQEFGAFIDSCKKPDDVCDVFLMAIRSVEKDYTRRQPSAKEAIKQAAMASAPPRAVADVQATHPKKQKHPTKNNTKKQPLRFVASESALEDMFMLPMGLQKPAPRVTTIKKPYALNPKKRAAPTNYDNDDSDDDIWISSSAISTRFSDDDEDYGGRSSGNNKRKHNTPVNTRGIGADYRTDMNSGSSKRSKTFYTDDIVNFEIIQDDF